MADAYSDDDFYRAVPLHPDVVRWLISAGAIAPLNSTKGRPRTWSRPTIRRAARISALGAFGFSKRLALSLDALALSDAMFDPYDPDAPIPTEVKRRWFDDESHVADLREDEPDRNDVRICVVNGLFIAFMGILKPWKLEAGKFLRSATSQDPRHWLLDQNAAYIIAAQPHDHVVQHRIDALEPSSTRIQIDPSIDLRAAKRQTRWPTSLTEVNLTRATLIAMRRLTGQTVRYE